MTEGFVTVAVPEDWERGKRGSVGIPIYACDVRIIDETGNELPPGEAGEIAGYSPGLMKGYRGAPALTQELVWRGPRGRTYIKSGDIGRLDEDGFLYVEGRVKDMIKSGGLNVYASDIEGVFTEHPDVVECAAIAIPHPKWQETPLLLAIVREGCTTTEEEFGSGGTGNSGSTSASPSRVSPAGLPPGDLRQGSQTSPCARPTGRGRALIDRFPGFLPRNRA